MDGVDIGIVATGFIALGVSQMTLHYKMGRVEQKLDYMNGYSKKRKRR